MRSTTDLKKGIIRAEIEIDVSPEAVFDSLTSSSELATWWGAPEAYLTKDWKSDLRVGGERSCTCVSADGKISDVRGEYRVINRPHLLEWTWEAKRDNYSRTLVRIEIKKTSKGSLLVLEHSGFSPDSQALGSHEQGWRKALGWLSAYTTQGRLAE